MTREAINQRKCKSMEASEASIIRTADVRYYGQGFELEIPVATPFSRINLIDMIFDAIDANLEWDIVLCMVDGHAVITEGQQKNAVKGSTLIKAGIAADPNTFYLQDAHHMVIWPFHSELRLIDETVYMGCSTPLDEVAKRPLTPGDIGRYSGPIIKPG